MNLSQLKFDAKDIVKLVGFLTVIGSMWVDLKTDQVKAQEQRSFLQYQIDELKKLCAIKPDEVRIIKSHE